MSDPADVSLENITTIIVSNGTLNATLSGGGGGNNEDTVNFIALAVALVALLGTVAQVLQQYYASAAGFANCGENVMGEWFKTARRIFRPTELRFEVQFEAPVIFVCPPDNTRGPVKGEPIQFVSGTTESLTATRSLSAEKEAQTSRESKVHTADNERATWVTLLSQLHTMEKESREWQELHYPKPTQSDTLDFGPKPKLRNPELEGHTLAVALQAKKRSWDNMPTDVKKPYATTTICHMLEIAAIMGIYWKEFDRSKDRYRAEGNGYILTGAQITDLGLMFTFQISGGSQFHANRVTPVDEVKELCFGTVSTIFRADKDSRRLGVLNEDPRDLGILQLGSMNEISESMVLIDCNTVTASYFRRQDTKHRHLFPVPFELLGMLCKNLHVRGTPFRMVPNPTPYHWDTKFFNLRKLVTEYHKRIQKLDLATKNVSGFNKFEGLADRVVRELQRNKNEERRRRTAERDLLEQKKELIEREKIQQRTANLQREGTDAASSGVDVNGAAAPWWKKVPLKLRNSKSSGRDVEKQAPATEPQSQTVTRTPTPTPQILTGEASKPMAAKGMKSRPGYTMDLLDALDDALKECDNYLLTQDPGLVRTVLREHFQEVLKLLNGDDEDDDHPEVHHSRSRSRHSRTHRGKKDDPNKPRKFRNFDEVDQAGPEDRQKKFMDIYFDQVMHEVKKLAASSRNKMTFYRRPSRQGTQDTIATPTSPRTPFLMPADVMSGDPSDAESDADGSQKDAKKDEPKAAAIWCVLIFRMLCWLTLHDFDKMDVQIPKSELLGSRLPVYIS
ncbi:hypothetical protein OQA88_2480 [Cercophora sp. LCS_1]